MEEGDDGGEDPYGGMGDDDGYGDEGGNQEVAEAFEAFA